MVIKLVQRRSAISSVSILEAFSSTGTGCAIVGAFSVFGDVKQKHDLIGTSESILSLASLKIAEGYSSRTSIIDYVEVYLPTR
jgi:hypothetical protein